ncbi:putative pentatricopeptide repeat-containing protein At3g23330 [Durio zibethinus]|uniref:Pentatricopeptide repeat-containing protein At3g23330 n=1 Tax=Durio zibethinus TaxID=66656 RepID=A0A6P5Z5B3_DURZI|nr:putative pentatricopeptide repeat-containing protein At3g23330 [Durio zibethinus]
MRFESITKFLQIFSQTKNLKATKILHADLLKKGLLFLSPNIQSKLILTYVTCLDRKTNLKILTNCFKSINPKNPLLFNVIISDFSKNGFAFFALKTLSFMHFNGISLDTYALCSSLTASSSLRNVEFGRQIHSHVAKSGWLSSVFVGTALVSLYAKLSLFADAALVFDEIPMKNSVCANALLSGFCEAKFWIEGLELVRKMPELSLDYDHFSLSAILRVCTGLSAIQFGRQVHGYLIRKVYNLGEDVFLQSSLIEMYGKCGLVVEALQVFNLSGLRLGGEKRRDIVLWTSMLGVYGRNGHFEDVVLLFKEMLKEGINPDEVAFVTVISACGHTGQIRLGLEYFDSMTHVYKLIPGPEHYSCVVDLLCRAGQLEKTMKVVNEMLQKGHNNGSVSLWVALLSACCDHENVELGKFAAQKALELDSQNVGIYVKLSNLYARFGMWDEIGQLREVMKQRGLKKDVAFSWIEVTS